MRPGHNSSRRLEEGGQAHPEIEVVLVAAAKGQLIDEDGPQREPLAPCLAQNARNLVAPTTSGGNHAGLKRAHKVATHLMGRLHLLLLRSSLRYEE